MLVNLCLNSFVLTFNFCASAFFVNQRLLHDKKLVGNCLVDLDLAIILLSDLLELSFKHALIVCTSLGGSDLCLELSYLLLEPVVLKSGFRKVNTLLGELTDGFILFSF